LVKFVEHRIGDKRIVRLIQHWLKAGVMEEGIRIQSEEGTPQGGLISPILANIYGRLFGRISTVPSMAS
jgi:RNA-directed DNA polymerase